MAKDLTAKDVQFAMEYQRATLQCNPPKSMGGKPSWHLSNGDAVKASVVDEVFKRFNLHVIVRLGDGTSSYAWGKAAA